MDGELIHEAGNEFHILGCLNCFILIPSTPARFEGRRSTESSYALQLLGTGGQGHCHVDFAVFWSKLLKYLTNNFFLR